MLDCRTVGPLDDIFRGVERGGGGEGGLTPLQEFSSHEATAGFMPNTAGEPGACKSPSWSSAEPWWRCRGRKTGGFSDPVFYFALNSKKNTFMGHFFCVLHLKVKGKLVKSRKSHNILPNIGNLILS